MISDEQLLHAYARDHSESAFGELVSRHLDYVYSAALRVVNGDTPLAQDVTQTVFIELARQGRSLPPDVALAAWLHRHTCYTAAKAVRTERRRQTREHTAMEMRALDDHTRPEWEQVAPYLDESLNQLNPADREALVLRFLRQQNLRAVGVALGISEDAAQKRVDRALEKLHVLLQQRGATLSLAALGTALATEAVTAAPTGLAGSVAATALASAAVGAGITGTLVKLMAMTKLKFGIIGVLVVAGIAIPLAIQKQSQATLREENQALREQVEQLRGTAEQAARAKVDQDALDKLRRDQSELLRLRGEVIALRNASKASALQTLPADRANPGASPLPDTVPRMTVLQANVRSRIGSGDTLVTGGWISGPGKRIFVLATPSILGENADQVNIMTKVIEVPEAELSKVGLDTFRAEGDESSLHQVFDAGHADKLLQELQAIDGTSLIASGGVSVSDGRQCQIRSTSDAKVIDGAKVDLGPVIDIVPVISGDKKVVDITLRALINRLAAKAQ